MTFIRTTAIAMGAVAAAASLAGCATVPPFTVEERLWFDKATGADITGMPPGLRLQPIGLEYSGPGEYPPPVRGFYRGPPPPPDEP